MSDDTLTQFVAHYAGDAAKISFQWNGKHEDGFVDANEEFRETVLDYVIGQPEDVPLALLVDLYRALTEYSTEAWAIDERVENIARLMLERGGAHVAHDFISGAWQSFDAQSATLFEGAPKSVIDECLALARGKLESKTSEEERALWEFGVAHFETLLKHAS